MKREEPVTHLKGVGEKTKKLLEKLEIRTIGDLLHDYPRTYRSFPEEKPAAMLQEGETAAVLAAVCRPPAVQYVRGMQILTAELADDSGSVKARWFHMPWLKNTLRPGARYIFYGRVSSKNGRLTLDQPAVYQPAQYQELKKALQPVYELTKGVSSQMLSKLMRQALDGTEPEQEYLPSDLRRRYELAEPGFALEEIHFPGNEQSMQLARKRLVFDEFFLFILALRYEKAHRQEENGCRFHRDPLTDQIIGRLGYPLTGAQKRVWEEIQRDVTGPHAMMRLIQGDVGSGKTILAFLAMILAAANHWQSALMAPTEVLARQHEAALRELLETQGLPFQIVLLTGSMTAGEKRRAYAKIAAQEADMVIGTHAVIQEKVSFARLGLVITDEQHRFGVRQRELLGEKGRMRDNHGAADQKSAAGQQIGDAGQKGTSGVGTPHTIVMSATPIPRTLAVILYGDLEISLLDEMPSGRLPIKNCVVDTSWRKKAYEFIQREIRQGHQAYVICPLAEESEMIDAEDVLSYSEQLKGILPGDITVSALHGKMKPKEKNEIMERFVQGEIQVLVSTTVVEVGVNVPNATVMMIENAERFGLAQLHQLRGRVGRGDWQSYCIMISGNGDVKHQKRLQIMSRSNDGFFIAEEDLKLRGPGDLLGVRQSGMMEFKIGDIYTDAAILKQAAEAAGNLLAEDPDLEAGEHLAIRRKLDFFLSNDLKKLSL